MNKPFTPPNPSPLPTHLILSRAELEIALTNLATPQRREDIMDTIETMLSLPASMGVGRAITIISAIAWLTDESDRAPGFDGPGELKPSREA